MSKQHSSSAEPGLPDDMTEQCLFVMKVCNRKDVIRDAPLAKHIDGNRVMLGGSSFKIQCICHRRVSILSDWQCRCTPHASLRPHKPANSDEIGVQMGLGSKLFKGLYKVLRTRRMEARLDGR